MKIPVLLFCLFSLSHTVPISPDKKKLYHHITSGKGLYSPLDRVEVLNATNFKKMVFDKSDRRAWIVEFYNSWCGHCLRFAPTWKSFAWDVSGWKKVVRVGAVDCSNDRNTPLCRDYEVMFYPMIKFFPATAGEDYIGMGIAQGSVEQLRDKVVEAFRANSTVPDLGVYRGGRVDGLWEGLPSVVRFVVTVLESEQSSVGAQLALDLVSVNEATVRLARTGNSELVKALGVSPGDKLVVVDRDLRPSTLEVSQWSREGVHRAVVAWLRDKELEIEHLEKRVESEALEGDVKEMAELMQMEERIKSKLHLEELSDTVFQLDIERALKHTLTHEIPTKKLIEGEVMVALRNYLKILSSNFPFGERGLRYLREIKEVVGNRSWISGLEFEGIVGKAEENHRPVYLEPSGWVGCRGSRPNLRGFPCALWLMFHTLTIHGPPPSPPTAVLDTVLGYVKHFFGCTDCAQHFQEMASTIDTSVKTADDSVLWLWEAHNAANRRLGGDPKTEDPRHPKVQFPPPSLCPSCYTLDHSFSRPDVLRFLRSMFHNISFLLLDELPKPSTSNPQDPLYNNLLRHTVVGEQNFLYSNDETKPAIFNIFDLSLCVVLYICCIAVVLMVSIKFFLRKTYRRKVYVYDLFQKV